MTALHNCISNYIAYRAYDIITEHNIVKEKRNHNRTESLIKLAHMEQFCGRPISFSHENHFLFFLLTQTILKNILEYFKYRLWKAENSFVPEQISHYCRGAHTSRRKKCLHKVKEYRLFENKLQSK